MRATRRYWGFAAVGGFLAVLAVVLARPVLLVGAAGIGAWLIAAQYRFYRRLERTLDAIGVEQSVGRPRLTVEEPCSVVLSITLSEPSPLALRVTPGTPVGAAGFTPGEHALAIERGAREARTAGTVEWRVAGAAAFDPPRITATDPFGFLAETVERGPAPTVTVKPRAPRNVHVGEGGEQIAAAYGEHGTGRLGSGLDPAELREYVPGDAADEIDWKATARLAEPYVRKHEAETDRRTALLIDHRGSTGAGPDGETALDYLRQVALAFVASARALSDPLGCYAVGDAGLTARIDPAGTDETYDRVDAALLDLVPTTPEHPEEDRRRGARRGPADARRVAAALGEETAFEATLRPFFAASDPYVQRIAGDPLFETARRAIARLDGTVWTAIFTDDTRRERLRETVKVARRGDDRVLVFLAPHVLFEAGGLADLDAAYDRYVAFEEFRRELARLPRVSAFEVAPGDRIDAVLATGRRRRSTARAGGV